MNWQRAAVVIGSVLLVFTLLALSGSPVVEVMSQLLRGSMGSPQAWSGTLRETAPLLLLGIGVFLALRAGLFNIGAEGQFLVGALAAAVVALRIPGPVGLILAAVAGALLGALWALPAGLIKAYRGGHEVIVTIMLNNVAALVTTALAAHQLKDPSQQSPSTAELATRLPGVVSGQVEISWLLVVGLMMAVGLYVWLSRTVKGFELRLVGANATAAAYAGVEPKPVLAGAMAVSGAIAGLAGALQVLAVEGRFYAGMSPGYGFDALGVALLAGSHPLAVVPSALLFGILAKGGSAIQIFGVPKGITLVLVGILIVNAAALRVRGASRA